MPNQDTLGQLAHTYNTLSKALDAMVATIADLADHNTKTVPKGLSDLRDELITNMRLVSERINAELSPRWDASDPRDFLFGLSQLIPKIVSNIERVEVIEDRDRTPKSVRFVFDAFNDVTFRIEVA